MSSLLGLFADAPPAAGQPRVVPIRERAAAEPRTPANSIHRQQIHALVQQVFFSHESTLVRHAGFVAVEASTEMASLCLEVAQVLAAENAYDVGLIDARPSSVALHAELRMPHPNRAESSWQIAPRLWMVPRQSWLPVGSEDRINDQNLNRLRELISDFDFSVLCCGPVSWLTASLGQACDGMVLVLTANKTRRLVAAQVKEQLSKAHVALLGTVLADRRFPVPQGLYRSL